MQSVVDRNVVMRRMAVIQNQRRFAYFAVLHFKVHFVCCCLQANRQTETDIRKTDGLDFLRKARTIPLTLSCYLRLRKQRKTKGWEMHRTRPLDVLWRGVSLNNTSPEYISHQNSGSEHCHCNLTFWRLNYFIFILAHPVCNANNTRTKHVRILKQTAF